MRTVPSVSGERERVVRDSTRAVTADRALCRQITAVLFTDEQPIIRAFEGEPVLEVMGMFVWALDHDHEPDFDAAVVLPAWAKKRGRGHWRQDRSADVERATREHDRDRKQRREECADCKGHFPVREMREAGEDHLTWYEDDLLCKRCAKSAGVA